MTAKVWVVVEYGGDKGYTLVGATNDEDYAEQACIALRLVDKEGHRYEKECVDYRQV